MRFTSLVTAFTAFAVAVALEFTDPTFNDITAGSPFDFTWTNATGDVTLTLMNGSPLNLQVVSTIASGLTGTSYVWNVPATLDADTYTIRISDSTSTPNYSTQFQLIGGVTTTSSATSTTAASSSATAASTTETGSTTKSSGSTATSSGSSATTSASKTSSGSSSKTSSASSSSSSTAAPKSSAAGLSSPLALVFLALAAMITLN